MRIQGLLSMIAAIFGLIGSILIARGVLFLKIETIANLSGLSGRWLYSLDKINAWSAQKADCITGLIFICIAFVIQVVSMLSEDNVIYPSTPKTKIVASLIIICLFLYLGATKISNLWSGYIQKQTGTYLLHNYCQNSLKATINSDQYKNLEEMAGELLQLERRPQESKLDFLRRLANDIHWSIAQVDCSELVEDKPKPVTSR